MSQKIRPEPLIMNDCSFTEAQLISFIEDSVKDWTKIVKNLPKKSYRVIDVGAGNGASLIAMAQLGLLKEGYLVEPNFKRWKKPLKKLGYGSDFFKKHNIHLLENDGRDLNIPYNKADLVIKTFNGWVWWSDFLSKIKNKCHLIASIVDDESVLLFKDLTLVKTRVVECNKYHFLFKEEYVSGKNKN